MQPSKWECTASSAGEGGGRKQEKMRCTEMGPIDNAANGKEFPEWFKMAFLRPCSLEWRAEAVVCYPLLGSLSPFACQ